VTPVHEASAYEACIRPYRFDRIEVTANVFTTPLGSHPAAAFQTPTENVRFSILGEFHCDYPTGPHLGHLAALAQEITGRAGFYGMQSSRKL
jgi:hypothetical protein